MTIGRVAKAAGVAPTAIRFYESCGVLQSPPRKNGIRDYDPAVVEQLRIIRYFRSVGVSVDDLAAMVTQDEGPRAQSRHELVLRRIDEIDQIMREARAMKGRLRKLLACRCGGNLERCVIFKEPRARPSGKHRR